MLLPVIVVVVGRRGASHEPGTHRSPGVAARLAILLWPNALG